MYDFAFDFLKLSLERAISRSLDGRESIGFDEAETNCGIARILGILQLRQLDIYSSRTSDRDLSSSNSLRTQTVQKASSSLVPKQCAWSSPGFCRTVPLGHWQLATGE